MKPHLIIAAFILPTLALAESAWQVLPIEGSGRYFYQTDQGLHLITSSGSVLETSDGLDWMPVAQLGGARAKVLAGSGIRVESGLSVAVRSGSITSLYRTVNGFEWETAIDGEALGAEQMSLSFSPQLAAGRLGWTSGSAPAVIWHSSDSFNWQEVYRNDSIALESGLRQSGDALTINLESPQDGGWLNSADLLQWTKYSAQPNAFIQVDNYFVGLNTGPVLHGTIFYSQDGSNWEMILDPPGSSPAKQLIHAAGVFILTNGSDGVYYSSDGLNWNEANIASEDIRALASGPMKVTFGYHDGAFWYRLIVVAPPGFPVPDPDRLVFQSVDGSSWFQSDWPDDFSNEAELPVKNPLYTNPPAPVGSPGGSLLSAKEVAIDGWSLLMTEVPEGRRMGLYLKSGDGEYGIVNSSWGRVDLFYPYSEPEDIAAIGGTFVALNENGYIGYFDPAADYLAQPLGLKASKGTYDDHIQLEWMAVEGAEAYRIYRATSADPEAFAELAVTAEATFTDIYDLEVGTVYFYHVQTFSATRQSLASPVVTGHLWSLSSSSNNYSWPGLVFEIGWPTYLPDGSKKPLLFIEYNAHYPWIYFRDHHWLYCCERPGNLWLWDAQLGWLWTRQAHYPFLYSMREKAWLYFIAAGEEARWFYHYGQAGYQSVSR